MSVDLKLFCFTGQVVVGIVVVLVVVVVVIVVVVVVVGVEVMGNTLISAQYCPYRQGLWLMHDSE